MQSQPTPAADLCGLYDEDFFEWTRRNAELLRAGQVRASDIQHIAQAIEDLGKQDLKELHRRARALLAHLLVGQLQPAKHSQSRLGPITEERIWLQGLVEYSPSLKIRLANELPVVYAEAVRLAMAMARSTPGCGRFPPKCPFTVEQILDPEFLPQLLKWRFQPEKRSASWQNTVAVQRTGVARFFARYPSLRGRVTPNLPVNYGFALSRAVRETGLPKNHFSTECPFSVEQILDPEFLP